MKHNRTKFDKLLIIPYDSYTNYVNLPPTILDKLTKKPNIKTPYFFQLKTSYDVSYYVGVKEFTAEQNTIEIPTWIATDIGEDEIAINLITDIPKGKYVKLDVLSDSFYSLPDNDVILEKALSEYCLLELNQIIYVSLLDEIYKIKIVDIKTDMDESTNIIDIINVDLNVDFETIPPKQKELLSNPDEGIASLITNPKISEVEDHDKVDLPIQRLSIDELRKARIKRFEQL